MSELNAFSVTTVCDDNRMNVSLNIDAERLEYLQGFIEKKYQEWRSETPKNPEMIRRFSRLLELVTEECQNANETAFVSSSIFYWMGVNDGIERPEFALIVFNAGGK